MHKSTILITGGAGYIGSHVALYLYQQDHTIIIIDTYKPHTPHPFASYITASISDEKQLSALFANHQIDVVIHCAGLSDHTGSSLSCPLDFYSAHVNGTMSLLKLMIDHEIKKIVYCSSATVYEPHNMDGIDETFPCKPVTPFGKTKQMVETLLTDCQHAYNVHSVVLRYPTVGGVMPHFFNTQPIINSQSLISSIINAVHTKQPFVIPGTTYDTPDGTHIDDYIHVWDVAAATSHAVDHLISDLPSDTFNIGTCHGYSVKQLIKLTEHMTQQKLQTIPGKIQHGRPARCILDPTRAQNILGWQPVYSSIEDILRLALLAQDGIR